MHLLVKYTVNDGMAEAQRAAFRTFVGGLKAAGDAGYSYTGFETDDPTQFIGLLEFEDEAARKRFLETDAFKAYREGAKDRFPHPPAATPMQKVASTED